MANTLSSCPFVWIFNFIGMLSVLRSTSSFDMLGPQRLSYQSAWRRFRPSEQRFLLRRRRTTVITSQQSDGDSKETKLVNTIGTKPNQVDWNDRVGMQAKWNNKEKGWKVKVEWKQTPFGAGLFASQDIANGTKLRVGKNGINLIQFTSIEGIETFCRGQGESMTDDEEIDAKLKYVKDYMWGFNPNADERGYDIPTDDEQMIKKQEAERFFGMWCPGNGLNHSPNPNTVYRASQENGGTKVGIDLVAINDIKEGDELFDDYRRHGTAPKWLLEFADKYNVTLNFAECNDFVGE